MKFGIKKKFFEDGVNFQLNQRRREICFRGESRTRTQPVLHVKRENPDCEQTLISPSQLLWVINVSVHTQA